MIKPVVLALGLLAATPSFAAPVVNAPTQGPSVAGKSTSCIQRRLIQSIKPDGRALVFRMSAGRDFRSELAHTCSFAPGAQQYVIRSSSTQLCAGEIIDVIGLGGGAAFASCQVGRFTALPDTRASR